MMGPGGEFGGGNQAAQQAVANLQLQLRKTEKRVEQLRLVVRGLFCLLAEKTGATEAELQDQLVALGEEAQAKAPDECPDCGREFRNAGLKCMYCGADRPVKSVFDML